MTTEGILIRELKDLLNVPVGEREAFLKALEAWCRFVFALQDYQNLDGQWLTEVPLFRWCPPETQTAQLVKAEPLDNTDGIPPSLPETAGDSVTEK